MVRLLAAKDVLDRAGFRPDDNVNAMPANAGFMICHPVATVAPTKLEDYRVHQDPPGISGELVEGRIVYDAFVLDNKRKAIYYVENKPAV